MSLLDRSKISLATLRRLVAGDLSRFETAFAEVAVGDTELTRDICDHIRKGKSKRFRPMLLLLAAKGDGPVPPAAVTAAACVELVHTATLVHDDFIDGAVTRRGLPSVLEAWGGAAALIMGDYLYSRALDVLCRHELHDAVRLLSRTTVLMSEAEMLQLELKYDLGISEDQYLRVIYQKTASLIEASCRIGISFHPVDREQEESLALFGRKIGLVFQITDDIFDYLGDERRLGKPTGQDWEEGRITLPLIAALARAGDGARRSVADLAASRDAAERAAGWTTVKSLVLQNGGVDHAFAMSRRLGAEAKEALAPLTPGPRRDLLAEAVEYVINRLN